MFTTTVEDSATGRGMRRVVAAAVVLGLLAVGLTAREAAAAAGAVAGTSAARPYAIVYSGQTVCYNATGQIAAPAAGRAFYGQDARNAGASSSYTDNSDGTVGDHVTGLMWQQSPDTGGDGTITVTTAAGASSGSRFRVRR